MHITEQPLDERFPYVGSWEQFISDIEETRKIGADELFIDSQGETAEGYVDVMERVKP